jgi:hypothetical protein
LGLTHACSGVHPLNQSPGKAGWPIGSIMTGSEAAAIDSEITQMRLVHPSIGLAAYLCDAGVHGLPGRASEKTRMPARAQLSLWHETGSAQQRGAGSKTMAGSSPAMTVGGSMTVGGNCVGDSILAPMGLGQREVRMHCPIANLCENARKCGGARRGNR